MRQVYATLDLAACKVVSVHLNKPKQKEPPLCVLLCDIGTYHRLKKTRKEGTHYDVDVFVSGDTVYCKDIWEHMKEDRKRGNLERKIDSIMDDASSRYPYASDYQTKFNSLSLEEKVEAIFAMSFKALVNLERKADAQEYQ